MQRIITIMRLVILVIWNLQQRASKITLDICMPWGFRLDIPPTTHVILRQLNSHLHYHKLLPILLKNKKPSRSISTFLYL